MTQVNGTRYGLFRSGRVPPPARPDASPRRAQGIAARRREESSVGIGRFRNREAGWFDALPYALIAIGAVLRVVPHPWNFAPIGAMALFGGAVLPRGVGIAVPLAALALSDAVLGFYP